MADHEHPAEEQPCIFCLQETLREVQGLAENHRDRHLIEGLDPVGAHPQMKLTAGAPTHRAPEGTFCRVVPDSTLHQNSDGAAGWTLVDTGGTGAPKGVDYLVGTANADLTAEVVVGVTPQGELGGTWPSPTVDPTHSGTPHHTKFTASEARTAVPYVVTISFGWDPQSPQVFAP